MLAENLETGARDGAEGDETQVAWAPLLVEGGRQLARHGPNVARSVPGIATLMEWLSENATSPKQDTSEDYDPAAPQPPIAGVTERTDIADPPPPVPPSEPPKDPSPTKTEFPADPPFEEIDLSNPIPDDIEPGIFVYPLPSDDLKGPTIVENRKGNPNTKAELDDLRDIVEAQPGMKHIAGGRVSDKHPNVVDGKMKPGDELGEYHIKGPGGLFDADSRPGGKFADLTFETPSGRRVHYQTVDVDSNGKPRSRELNNAESIRRQDPGSIVILVPKGAQLGRSAPKKTD